MNKIIRNIYFNGRVSSADSKDYDSSVMLNGHFDSPLGSPGAGDCGSCVGGYTKQFIFELQNGIHYFWLGSCDGINCSTFFYAASMLELARLITDSGWVPPQPIIFLFNGAEELFMLVRCSNEIKSVRKNDCSLVSIVTL